MDKRCIHIPIAFISKYGMALKEAAIFALLCEQCIDGTGECRVPIAYLQQAIGCGRTSVLESIKKLVARGCFTYEPDLSGFGVGNRFTISAEWISVIYPMESEGPPTKSEGEDSLSLSKCEAPPVECKALLAETEGGGVSLHLKCEASPVECEDPLTRIETGVYSPPLKYEDPITECERVHIAETAKPELNAYRALRSKDIESVIRCSPAASLDLIPHVAEKEGKEGNIKDNKEIIIKAENNDGKKENTERKKIERPLADGLLPLDIEVLERNPASLRVMTKQQKISARLLREQKFKEALYPFCESRGGPYSAEMVESFFNYWSEPNPSGNKMKYEMQQTFDIARRLATWHNNEENKYGRRQSTQMATGCNRHEYGNARDTLDFMVNGGQDILSFDNF